MAPRRISRSLPINNTKFTHKINQQRIIRRNNLKQLLIMLLLSLFQGTKEQGRPSGSLPLDRGIKLLKFRKDIFNLSLIMLQCYGLCQDTGDDVNVYMINLLNDNVILIQLAVRSQCWVGNEEELFVMASILKYIDTKTFGVVNER